MDKRALIVLAIIFGGLFLVFFGFLLLAGSAMQGTGRTALGTGPKIGVVEVTDVIGDAEQTLRDLKAFREDDGIRAILVRINSPGGAVAPSQEIHDAILETRKVKRVVASLSTVAASGGYYVAVAADEIVANPGTLTGSIGVIMQFPKFKELAEWAKVDVETVKSGQFKDVGNALRDTSDAERDLLQAVVMDVYEQFLGAVAEGRNMSPDAVRPYADGRILTGQQAHEAGLVDHLGGLEFAVDRLMELADLTGEPRLIYPQESSEELLRRLLSEGAQGVASAVRNEVTEGTVGGTGLFFLAEGLAR